MLVKLMRREDKEDRHGPYLPVVSPSTEVKPKSPVWGNIVAANGFCVLGDDLLGVWTKEEIDVKLSASRPINQARGRRQTHLRAWLRYKFDSTSCALLFKKRTP